MSDSVESSKVEELRQLSEKYELRRSRSASAVVLAGVSATVAVFAAIFGLYAAFLYYHGAVKAVEASTYAAESLSKRTESLTSELDLTRRQIAELNAEISNLRSSLLQAGETKSIEGRVMTCPDGYYVKGWAFQDEPGLAHGALWGPSAICGQLNVGSQLKRGK